jgi:hypothetical protein
LLGDIRIKAHISNGVFPSIWKEAAIVPIFKKGSIVFVTNYGPISLLKNSKIFKIITHDQLSSYFKPKLHNLNMDLLNLNQL